MTQEPSSNTTQHVQKYRRAGTRAERAMVADPQQHENWDRYSADLMHAQGSARITQTWSPQQFQGMNALIAIVLSIVVVSCELSDS